MSSEDPQVEDTGSSSEGTACGIFPKETKLAMLCRLGKIVKSDTFIPQTQSVLDGVNLSQTLHKLSFDILQALDSCSTQPSKMNFPQAWLGSQLGLSIAISGTLLFAVLALLGNIFGDNDPHAIKRFFARSWPYLRNSIKIVKNNFKGLRSIFFTISQFNPGDLTPLFMEIFCAIGLLSLVVRVFNTYFIEARKTLTLVEMPKILAELAALSDTLSAAIALHTQDLHPYLQQFDDLKQQAQQKRMKNWVNYSLVATNIYCGIIDSLYQFMGLSSFISLGFSPLFIGCTVFSAVYVILGVVTRVSEELENQRKLEVQVVEAEWRAALNALSLLKIMGRDVHEAREELQTIHQKLMQLRQFSRGVAFLHGLHSGLFAYSALSTMTLFAITVAGLFSVTLPGILIPVLMGLSLACMLIATAYHVWVQEAHRDALNQENETFQAGFRKAMDIPEELHALKALKQPSKAPWVRSREFLEPVRMLFSGAKKGSGFVEFNYMDRINYDSSPVVAIIAIVSMVVHGIIFFLAGLAKHLGKDVEVREFRPELEKLPLRPAAENASPTQDEKSGSSTPPKSQTKRNRSLTTTAYTGNMPKPTPPLSRRSSHGNLSMFSQVSSCAGQTTTQSNHQQNQPSISAC